jgi:hypothetical protein
MTNEKRLHKNLEIWAQRNPKAALLIPYLEPDELPLEKYGNPAEAEAWFHRLDLDQKQILYVYGVGLGDYYRAAKDWLKANPDSHMVFLEDDLSIIKHLLETESGSALVRDPQVHLYYIHDLKESTAIFENLFWNFVQTHMHISALKYYEETKSERFADLQHRIQYDASIKNALLEEYLKYGVGFYKNFYPNLLFLTGSYLGNKMFGKFHKVPAIICGAGPSLQKHLHLLGNLKNNALIFAGGSAMNALNSAHIQPHFGAGIDPNAEQYKRLSENSAFEVPFFYRNRMFHQAFQAIHGPRLYIPGSGGYAVSDWFEEKLGIKSELLDEGHNVVNFCLQIARHLGCDPIILVGVDLAYTENLQYAPGIVENAALDTTRVLHTTDFDRESLTKNDIFGNPVTTLWKWVAEAEWIGDFAKEHADIHIINCTEGGLGFPGVPNEPFSEIVDTYLKKSFDLNGRVHGEIQNSVMPQISYEKIVELMEQFAGSLERSEEYLTALLEESEVVKSRLRKAKAGDKVALQTGRAALCETELAEEPGYMYILEVLNLTISLVLTRELQAVENNKRLSENKRNLRKIEINDKKLQFLKDAAHFNREIIKLTLQGEILAKEALCTPTNINLKTS